MPELGMGVIFEVESVGVAAPFLEGTAVRSKLHIMCFKSDRLKCICTPMRMGPSGF